MSNLQLVRQTKTRRAIDDSLKEGERIVYLDDKNINSDVFFKRESNSLKKCFFKPQLVFSSSLLATKEWK